MSKETKLSTYDSVKSMVLRSEKEINSLIPTGASFNTRKILDQIYHQFKFSKGAEKLAACDPASIASSIKYCCMLGLEPGYGEGSADVYFITYSGQCKPQVSYIGDLKLARRSGHFSKIYTEIVYNDDKFRVWNDVSGQQFEHEVNSFADRDDEDIKCVYAVAVTRDGDVYLEVMTRGQIIELEAKTRKGGKQTDAWAKWWGQMARKTVLRRLLKYLPSTSESMLAESLDNQELVTIEAEPTETPKVMDIKQIATGK